MRGILIMISILLITTVCFGQSPTNLPLFDLSKMEYIGACRVSPASNGASSTNYAQGPIEYNAANHSLFIVGHPYQQAIGEFAIPELVVDSIIDNLNIADSLIQVFAEVLFSTTNGNPQNLDRIGGLEYMTGLDTPMLLVNAFEYYDAPGNNTQTTAIIQQADAIDSSTVDGFYRFIGGAGHTSGWISPIPHEWRDSLGGTHITGQSSGIPIISRTSVGPSAFAFDSALVFQPLSDSIATNTLMDFSLSNPLRADLYNSSLTNDVWTHLSKVNYGFIVPGTRTYFTIGYSGGHESGVCYKCTQNNGNVCGGYCAYDASDVYPYYWLWDVNEFLDVKAGTRASFDMEPYSYGKIKLPISTSSHLIAGGSFDPETMTLYLSVQFADYTQGNYSRPPVVITYSIADEYPYMLFESDNISIYAQAVKNQFLLLGDLSNYTIELLNINGTLLANIPTNSSEVIVDLTAYPIGSYFIRATSTNHAALEAQVLVERVTN